MNNLTQEIIYPKETIKVDRKYRSMATSAGHNGLCTLFSTHIHMLRSCAPPPSLRCFICAILFAHFVDWALASCTRANQRETGQRRYGKGDPIEGIGSCQHGLVCYGPTKLLTLLNAKNGWQLDFDRCVPGRLCWEKTQCWLLR